MLRVDIQAEYYKSVSASFPRCHQSEYPVIFAFCNTKENPWVLDLRCQEFRIMPRRGHLSNGLLG